MDAILDEQGVREYLQVEIQEHQQSTYRQASRGRPTQDTQFTRQVQSRFDLRWEINEQQLAAAVAGDGVFPLITNLRDWTEAEVLQAYKRQPIIENRFSQLKTDFCVAPVYLQSVTRIVGLLAVYFFALMVQSLLERELRQALAAQGLKSPNSFFQSGNLVPVNLNAEADDEIIVTDLPSLARHDEILFGVKLGNILANPIGALGDESGFGTLALFLGKHACPY